MVLTLWTFLFEKTDDILNRNKEDNTQDYMSRREGGKNMGERGKA